MSPQDGPGRTGRVVDFDGLDAGSDAGPDRSRVVSFDDLEPDTQDAPRSRVVSFDDLDRDEESDPARSRALSFDDEPDERPGAPAPGAAVDGLPGDDLPGDDGEVGGPVGDVVSFDGLDAARSRPATRRTRRTTTGGARTSADTARRAVSDATRDADARTDTRVDTPEPGHDGPDGGAATDEAVARPGGRGRRGGRETRGRDGGPGGRETRGRAGGRGGRGATAAGSTPQDDESRAREICLRLLTDRARTVKELADALRRKEIPDDVANRVLERFDEVGLVDDEAFAGQWVRSRHRHKGLGRRAIALELHRKGVDREIADEALSEIDPESEQARARELVDRKLRTMKVATKEDRQSAARRLVGMLARKGYGGGVAYGVVREAIAARGAEEDELGEDVPED